MDTSKSWKPNVVDTEGAVIKGRPHQMDTKNVVQ